MNFSASRSFFSKDVISELDVSRELVVWMRRRGMLAEGVVRSDIWALRAVISDSRVVILVLRLSTFVTAAASRDKASAFSLLRMLQSSRASWYFGSMT